MGSSVGKSLSISFFIGAALLAVFGIALRPDNPTDGAIQIALGVAMLGAGLFLRSGSSESRIAALGASGLVCAYGVFDLGTGNGYVPGTIVAAFAFVRLISAEAHFGPAAARPPGGQPIPYGAPAAYPQQAYPQQAYPQQAYPQQAYPQQAYPQQAYPQTPQPAPGPTDAPWALPTGGPAALPAPEQPAAPVAPPVVQPPSDPRFG